MEIATGRTASQTRTGPADRAKAAKNNITLAGGRGKTCELASACGDCTRCSDACPIKHASAEQVQRIASLLA